MILQHTTLRRNLGSILKRGLLCSKSKGKMKVVWLHDVDKVSWAFLHVVKRHGGRIEDVVTIAVNITDQLVRRSSVDGLFFVNSDVSATCLGEVTCFQAVAASPIKENET